MKDEKLIKEDQDAFIQLKEQSDEFTIFEKQLNIYTSLINYFRMISLFFFSMFLVLLTIKINSIHAVNWFHVFIPLILTLISSTVFLNCSLSIQIMIDKFENNSENKGTLISLICLNLSSLLLLIYLILVPLKILGIMDKSFNLISLPVFFLIVIGLFYFIFILPALFYLALYLEMVLISSYFISFIISFLLLGLKIDNNSEILFSYIFSPLYLSLGLHIIYNSMRGESVFKIFISNLMFTLILMSLFLLGLKLDNLISISYLMIMLLYIIAYVIFAVERIYIYHFQSESNEKICE